MRPLHEIAAEALRRRGIDTHTPVDDDRTAFDLQQWLVQQTTTALAAVVPPRFADAEVTDDRVHQWVRRFHRDRTRCPSLLLAGKPGTGKTHQAMAALKAVALAGAHARRPVRFRVASHPQLNDVLRPRSDGSHEDALHPYQQCELLLLDDIGAGRQNDWTADGLYRLVDHRWAASLPSIFVTNLAEGDLADAVGERVVSRLFDADRIVLRGNDRRRNPAGGAQ